MHGRRINTAVLWGFEDKDLGYIKETEDYIELATMLHFCAHHYKSRQIDVYIRFNKAYYTANVSAQLYHGIINNIIHFITTNGKCSNAVVEKTYISLLQGFVESVLDELYFRYEFRNDCKIISDVDFGCIFSERYKEFIDKIVDYVNNIKEGGSFKV